MIRRLARRGFSYSKPVTVFDEEITCMVLHPVTWPNHGPAIELGLAKEALGLARSLGWDTVKGPTGQVSDEEKESDDEDDEDDDGRGRP